MLNALKPKRFIATFPARDLVKPDDPTGGEMDSLSEYSLRKGYGLEIRRRRRKKKKPTVI